MYIVLYVTKSVRKRFYLLLFVLFVLLAAGALAKAVLPVSRGVLVQSLPLTGKMFVIDPGHGGYDPGTKRNNIEEKHLVLGISLILRDYLQSAGARVIMTRETDRDLLIIPTAGPKKQQDMKNRMLIVNGANADLLVSIHANSIDSSVWHGAQVFHKIDDEVSKTIAESIQQELKRVLGNTDRVVKPGNYFVLNEADSVGVLVECGFISNPLEAQLLSDPAYQAKVAWAIYLGLMRYYGQLPADR